MKICSKCKQTKALQDFYKDRTHKDGHTSQCKICKDTVKELWRKVNQPKINNRYKELRKLNPLKYRIIQKRSETKIRKTIKGNLDHRMATAVRLALIHGKQGRSWESLVGYSVNELKLHLEKHFQQGMSWVKFLEGKIHIDHIKPKCAFSYEKAVDKEFKECWSLDNLQPLWAIDNFKKIKEDKKQAKNRKNMIATLA
jgi:hypothetical protein